MKNIIVTNYLEFNEGNPVDVWNNLNKCLKEEGMNMIMFTPFKKIPGAKFKFFYTPRFHTDFDEQLQFKIEDIEKNFNFFLNTCLFTDYYKPNLLKIFYFWNKIIEDLNPSYILIWGNVNSASRILKTISTLAGIPSMILERGLIPNTFMINHIGLCSYNDLKNNFILQNFEYENDLENFNLAKNFYISLKKTKRPQKTNKNKIDKILQKNHGRKIVLILGHNDSNIIFNDNSKKNAFHIFTSTLEMYDYFSNNDFKKEKIQILFKAHPNDINEYDDNHNIENVSDCCIHDLFKISDLVLCMSSSAAYEAVLYEKKILMFEKNDLVLCANADVVEDKKNIKEDIINSLIKKENLKIKFYLNFLIKHFLIGWNKTYNGKTLKDLSVYIRNNSMNIKKNISFMEKISNHLDKDRKKSSDYYINKIVEYFRKEVQEKK